MTVRSPYGWVTAYVVFARAPLIRTRMRAKVILPPGGLLASAASTSFALPDPTASSAPACQKKASPSGALNSSAVVRQNGGPSRHRPSLRPSRSWYQAGISVAGSIGPAAARLA